MTSLSGFHRHDLDVRRELLRRAAAFDPDEWDAISCTPLDRELADVMVESAVGCAPVPVGIAEGFLVDGEDFAIPMAVEEPSVIAAAGFAARIVRASGGFRTWATEPVMRAQVFLEGVDDAGERRLGECEPRVRDLLRPRLSSLEQRGGGFRGMSVARLSACPVVRVDLLVDVRDAMGANRLNTAAEAARPLLEEASGGRALMCILSNEARERRAGAECRSAFRRLAPGLPDGVDGREAARRIAAASAVAHADPSRAVTHNKGIMNGISSLALATMNDTRAVEAAAHAWAARSGSYTALSEWAVDGETLVGRLELPLPLASVGGSVDFHPAARASLRLLGFPGATRLSRIGAALGLAQNFAAVFALVTRGIQAGHLRKHAARLAWGAGARGAEAREVADRLSRDGTLDARSARETLARVREARVREARP